MSEQQLQVAAAIGRRIMARFITDPRDHYVAMQRVSDPTGLTRRCIVREEIVEWQMVCGCYLLVTAGSARLYPCWKHGG